MSINLGTILGVMYVRSKEQQRREWLENIRHSQMMAAMAAQPQVRQVPGHVQSGPIPTADVLLDRGKRLQTSALFEDALALYTDAVRLDPSSARGHWLRARLLRDMGRIEEAVTSLGAYLNFAGSDPARQWNLLEHGRLLNLLGRFAEALPDLSDAQSNPDVRPFALFEHGRALVGLGRNEEALPEITSSLAEESMRPDEALARSTRADALMALGRFEDALPDLEAAAEDPSLRSRASWQRGWALGKLARHEEAILVLDSAVAEWNASPGGIEHDLAAALIARASSLSALGRWEEAASDQRRLATLLPDEPWVLSILAKSLINAGAHDAALDVYSRQAQLEPTNVWPVLRRAEILQRMGKPDEARVEVERTPHFDPLDDADALTVRGSLRYLLEDLEGALRDYSALVRLQPTNAQARLGRAYVLIDLGRLEAALDELEQAADLDPTDVGLVYDKACVLSRLTRCAESVECLRAAIAADEGRRASALEDDDFQNLRADAVHGPEFEALVNSR